ncbi:MAG: DUF2807 domain-containing protein [Clostridia bacterium]|nr:DUF2807 domain-containing protein [Clostridia bacterium]
MKDIKEFGRFISDKRKKAGMTQDGLAKIIGITPQAVSKWENGIGYPDVTLFPQIADALGVSISELFGENEAVKGTNFTPPAVYRDMIKVYDNGCYVCYSSKKVEKVDENAKIVYFKDGSIANIAEEYVKNTGIGEVILVYTDELRELVSVKENDIVTEKRVELFDSIELIIGGINVEIDVEQGNIPSVVFKCEKGVEETFDVFVKGGTLSILKKTLTNRTKKCKIKVTSPFKTGKKMHVNFNGNSTLNTEVDFENTTMFLQGNSSINGNNTDSLMLKISGNSSVDYGKVSKETEINVSGNSSISVKETGSAKIKVSGNSAIELMNVSKELDISVTGNSSIRASGEVDLLKCKFSGNGEFDGKLLSAETADVTITSRARVYVGHIKNASFERVGFHGRLIVGKRG